jgi:hypothetical protein
VNAWILEKELKPMVAPALVGDARRLADAVSPALKKGSPVDSLIFTPELKFIAIQSANDAMAGRFRKGGDGLPGYVRDYQQFLKDGLAKTSKVQ